MLPQTFKFVKSFFNFFLGRTPSCLFQDSNRPFINSGTLCAGAFSRRKEKYREAACEDKNIYPITPQRPVKIFGFCGKMGLFMV